jgi:thiamine kinase-like enzyme
MFEKAFADAAVAEEAARRSTRLRAQGLDTPAAKARGEHVEFDRIDGHAGLSLLRVAPARWLRPLARLHKCALNEIGAMDAFRRIHPRLHLLTSSALREAVVRLGTSPPRRTVLLHGDFHLGQVIEDGSGGMWLIDLDDLCLGPPEADLGNLIANLATQARLSGDLGSNVTAWRACILETWARLSAPLHARTLDHYIAVALIRRHLKLREAGRADFEAEIAAWIIPVAGRISPCGSAGYRG